MICSVGFLEAIEYMHESGKLKSYERGKITPTNRVKLSKAILIGVKYGHVEIVKFFLENEYPIEVYDIREAAVKYKKQDIIDYIDYLNTQSNFNI